ncbi:MAG: hypothetical protein ACQEQI_08850 [Bacillota bacterium]
MINFKFLTLTKLDLARLLAAFLLGVISGALILNLITARQIDNLIYQNKELSNKIAAKDQQLQKLEENLAHRKWKVVQKVKVIVNTDQNKHIKQQLTEKLHNLLASIIGRQMNQIDGTLISNTIDDRIINIEGTNYEIDLIWLLLQQEAVIKVDASSVN